MKALIDGDLILYRACHAVQSRVYVGYDKAGKPIASSSRKRELPECDRVEFKTSIDEDGYEDACEIIDDSLKKIWEETGCDEYTIYLTGRDNFRREIYEDYKGHRPEKPILHKALSLYMLDFIDTEMVHGEEADDALGIHQTDDTIICSYDKDLRMIPGKHYNFNKKEFFTITEEEGMLNFYKQLLTGDSTDNIPGLKGVGPKTAEKTLDGGVHERDLYGMVLHTYLNHKDLADVSEEDVIDTITCNARLLWIRREEGEMWSPPV